MPMYGSRDDISPERYLRRIRFVSDLSLYLSLPRSRSSVGIEESFEFHLPTYLASYEAKPVRPMLTLRFPFPHRLACTDIKEPRILANTLNPKRRERKKNWEIKKKKISSTGFLEIRVEYLFSPSVLVQRQK